MKERKLINETLSKNNVEKMYKHATDWEMISIKNIFKDWSLRLINNSYNSIMKGPKFNLKAGKGFKHTFPKEDRRMASIHIKK